MSSLEGIELTRTWVSRTWATSATCSIYLARLMGLGPKGTLAWWAPAQKGRILMASNIWT
jgi:hypothetical protein